ncbi:MAG: hypothetical protein JXQ82_03060 [Methanomicrobiaceae archaeon]|nr:hypothetical protein [Methanomicrobiaceae archaeon]
MTFTFTDQDESQLYLILSSAETLRNKNTELIKAAIDTNHYVIVVTTNQLYGMLQKSYKKKEIPLDKIYFIDTVTRYASGTDPEPADNCLFVSNPGNLTDIGIAITESLKNYEGKKTCLVFDSVNSSLIYVSSQNITKFIHFVSSKLRMLDISGIFLAVEKGLDPDILTKLTMFVDIVIDTDEDSANIDMRFAEDTHAELEILPSVSNSKNSSPEKNQQ